MVLHEMGRAKDAPSQRYFANPAFDRNFEAHVTPGTRVAYSQERDTPWGSFKYDNEYRTFRPRQLYRSRSCPNVPRIRL